MHCVACLSELKQELDKKGEVISELKEEKNDLVAAKQATEEELKKQKQISKGETRTLFIAVETL